MTEHADFYTKDTFDQWRQQASPAMRSWLDDEKERLVRCIGKGACVLDVGCNAGRHVALLAPHNLITGIDLNAASIDRARSNVSHPNAQFMVMDATAMTFEDCSFDYAYCMTNTFGVFLDAKQPILQEMRRVVRRGGRIFLSVYSEAALTERLATYQKVGLPGIEVDERGTIRSSDGFASEQFSEQALRALAEGAGMQITIEQSTPITYWCELR